MGKGEPAGIFYFCKRNSEQGEAECGFGLSQRVSGEIKELLPHVHIIGTTTAGEIMNGEEIPLAAPIFAIADVVDALASDRPYRKAWSLKSILEHIRQLSGTHFEPRLVDLFCEVKK